MIPDPSSNNTCIRTSVSFQEWFGPDVFAVYKHVEIVIIGNQSTIPDPPNNSTTTKHMRDFQPFETFSEHPQDVQQFTSTTGRCVDSKVVCIIEVSGRSTTLRVARASKILE